MVEEKKQLGQILIDAGKITEEQLEEALQYKRNHNMYLGKAIIAMGLLSEKEIVQTLSDQLGLPYLDLLDYEVQPKVMELIDEKFARENLVMPLFFIDNSLTIAISDPLNIEAIDDLGRQQGMKLDLILATESDIEQCIELYYRSSRYLTEREGATGQQVVSREIDEETQAIEAVNMFLNESIKIGASDIHIEPRESDVRIRYRVDGVLQQYYTVFRSSMSALVSRIKILSDMDIAESRRPQDGRFSYRNEDTEIDLRVSSFPTSNGEKVVLRLLDESRGKIELHKLGFTDDILEQWRKVIHTPNGIVLVSGPTGSGKTTTLYSTLNIINSVEVNIMTIEDPIEYRLENINQSQVNVKAGWTFSEALRSMLRQDPDIILVGEMRDVPTIELAIRAALTGHLVFSTIHTNDAASSFTRLLDMGIDPYLVTSTVRAVLAQRLIRLLCPRCKKPGKPTEKILQSLGIQAEFEGTLYEPAGCVYCRNSGYFGRSGIFEVLLPNAEITECVINRASVRDVEKLAVKNGMKTLKETGIEYVISGKTSVAEIMRVIKS
ncbi:Flp pilus assembly complex ATPase component TadA [bacterium]|nr:Flp pilus assembly complex ATPase component TadA [bacterium]MBU1634926.1 Flp pilus assembly complex ATPase component TadA [bacterium]MBU1872599.1 Flp pilus assembly complex ATPase component TadA [bacterium]